MAFRGRGRGRGGFGGGGSFYAKQEPFVLFPEVGLPNVRDVSEEERLLVVRNSKLNSYWRSSPYYLQESGSHVLGQYSDIERFCDRGKPQIKQSRGSFMQFLEASSSNFPKELVGDVGSHQKEKRRKVQWNQKSDLRKLDLLEKLEKKFQGEDGKQETEKKEGEEEDPENEEGDDDEEVSDNDDYEQNVDFDDDEDDFNMADDNNDDEGIY